MALTTRVWGLGQAAGARRGARRHLRPVLCASRPGLRCGRATSWSPRWPAAPSTRPRTSLTDLGLPLRVEEGRRVDPKVPEGRVVRRSRRAGLDDAAAAQREGVAERGRAGAGRAACWSAPPSGRRSCGCKADGLGLLRTVDVRTQRLPGRRHRRAVAGRRDQGRGCRAARQPRRARRHLRDARCHRRRRRPGPPKCCASRGFRVAVVGSYPYPGVRRASSCGRTRAAGFQVAPGDAISLEVSR